MHLNHSNNIWSLIMQIISFGRFYFLLNKQEISYWNLFVIWCLVVWDHL